jgi:hypothetical protein
VEEAYILVPSGRFCMRWPNLYAKEALDQGEQTVEDARQRKIRPQLFVVKVIALLPQALGPKRQIPVAQALCLGGTGSAGTVPEVFQVLLRRRERRLTQFLQEALDGCHIRRHLTGEAKFSETAIAQEPRLFLA